jgi:hypothetical protein
MDRSQNKRKEVKKWEGTVSRFLAAKTAKA